MSAPTPYFNSSFNETLLFLDAADASPSPSPDPGSDYESVIHRCHMNRELGLCHVKCMDMCAHSADGLCDDGGPGAQYQWCDFGTDCAQAAI